MEALEEDFMLLKLGDASTHSCKEWLVDNFIQKIGMCGQVSFNIGDITIDTFDLIKSSKILSTYQQRVHSHIELGCLDKVVLDLIARGPQEQLRDLEFMY